MSTSSLERILEKLNAEQHKDVLEGLQQLSEIDNETTKEYVQVSPLAFEITRSWKDGKTEAFELAALRALDAIFHKVEDAKVKLKLSWSLIKSDYFVGRVCAILGKSEIYDGSIITIRLLSFFASLDPSLARECLTRFDYSSILTKQDDKKTRHTHDKAMLVARKKQRDDLVAGIASLVSNCLNRGDEHAQRLIVDSALLSICLDSFVDLSNELVRGLVCGIEAHGTTKLYVSGKLLANMARCTRSHPDDAIRHEVSEFLRRIIATKGDKVGSKLIEYLDPFNEERHATLLEESLKYSKKVSLASFFETHRSLTVLEARPTHAWLRTVSLVARLIRTCGVPESFGTVEDAFKQIVPPESALPRASFSRMISHPNALVKLYGLDLLIHFLARAEVVLNRLNSAVDKRRFADQLIKRVIDASALIGAFKSDNSEQDRILINRSLRAIELFVQCGIDTGIDPLRFLAKLGTGEPLLDHRIISVATAASRHAASEDWLKNVTANKDDIATKDIDVCNLGALVLGLCNVKSDSVRRNGILLVCRAVELLPSTKLITSTLTPSRAAVVLDGEGIEYLVHIAVKAIVTLALRSPAYAKCFNIALINTRKNKRLDLSNSFAAELTKENLEFETKEMGDEEDSLKILRVKSDVITATDLIELAAGLVDWSDFPELICDELPRMVKQDKPQTLALVDAILTRFGNVHSSDVSPLGPLIIYRTLVGLADVLRPTKAFVSLNAMLQTIRSGPSSESSIVLDFRFQLKALCINLGRVWATLDDQYIRFDYVTAFISEEDINRVVRIYTKAGNVDGLVSLLEKASTSTLLRDAKLVRTLMETRDERCAHVLRQALASPDKFAVLSALEANIDLVGSLLDFAQTSTKWLEIVLVCARIPGPVSFTLSKAEIIPSIVTQYWSFSQCACKAMNDRMVSEVKATIKSEKAHSNIIASSLESEEFWTDKKWKKLILKRLFVDKLLPSVLDTLDVGNLWRLIDDRLSKFPSLVKTQTDIVASLIESEKGLGILIGLLERTLLPVDLIMPLVLSRAFDWSKCDQNRLRLIETCLAVDTASVVNAIAPNDRPTLLHAVLAGYTGTLGERDAKLRVILRRLEAFDAVSFNPAQFGFAFGPHLLPLDLYTETVIEGEAESTRFNIIFDRHLNWIVDGLDSTLLRRRPRLEVHFSEFDLIDEDTLTEREEAKYFSYDLTYLLRAIDFYIGLGAMVFNLPSDGEVTTQIVEPQTNQGDADSGALVVRSFPVRKFVLGGHLDLILFGLAHASTNIRSLAFACLRRFAQLVSRMPTGVFKERDELLLVLKVFREAVAEPMQRIPLLTIVHLQEFVHVICRQQAGHSQFQRVNAFFLGDGASWDLTDVPLFMQTFLSGSPQFEQDRVWTLNLISRGIATPKDLAVISRRFVLESCFELFASSRSDYSFRRAVLNLIEAIARCPSAGSPIDAGAKMLIERGFLAFCLDVFQQVLNGAPVWRLGDDRGEERLVELVSKLVDIVDEVAKRRQEFNDKVSDRDCERKRAKSYLGCEWTALEADWALFMPTLLKTIRWLSNAQPQALSREILGPLFSSHASRLHILPCDVLAEPIPYGALIAMFESGSMKVEKAEDANSIFALVKRLRVTDRAKYAESAIRQAVDHFESFDDLFIDFLALHEAESVEVRRSMIRCALIGATLRARVSPAMRSSESVRQLMGVVIPRLLSDDATRDILAYACRILLVGDIPAVDEALASIKVYLQEEELVQRG